MGADGETATTPEREPADAPANRVTQSADSETTSRHNVGSEDIEDESGSDTHPRKLFPDVRDAETQTEHAAALRQEAVPASPPAPPQKLTIKKCLEKPGVYIYHVSCLTVELDGQKKEWCVVKIGMTIDNTMDGRLQGELSDTRKWRSSPKLQFTIKSLKKDDGVGDLVACLSGPAWCGSEKKIGKRLGLPLGTGKVVWGPGVKQMTEEHSMVNESIMNQESSKITAWGWSMFLKKGGQGCATLVKTTIGPSELIIMRKEDMVQLRESFQENPALFSSTFPGTNVDDEKGPAWKLIEKICGTAAKSKLPPDWPDKRATVRFNKEDNLIGPLTLQLCRWEEKKGSPLKPQSELSLCIGARVELDDGKRRGQVKSHSGKGWWYVLLDAVDGKSELKCARTGKLRVLPGSEEEGQV